MAETDLETAFRRTKADSTLQWDLPTGERPELVIEVVEPRRGWGLPGLDVVAEIILWGIAVVVIGALLWFIYVSLRDVRLGRAAPEDETVPAYVPQARTVQRVLRDADALAAEGRFREAVHALLLRAVDDIDRSMPGVVRRSLTAREIARDARLAGRVREAFVTVARINEPGWFGAKPVTQADWTRARQAYAALGNPAAAPGGMQTA